MTFWKSQKLIPSKKKQSFTIAKISSCKIQKIANLQNYTPTKILCHTVVASCYGNRRQAPARWATWLVFRLYLITLFIKQIKVIKMKILRNSQETCHKGMLQRNEIRQTNYGRTLEIAMYQRYNLFYLQVSVNLNFEKKN